MIAITKNKINNHDLSLKRILFNLIQPSIRMEILLLIDNYIKLPKLGLVRFAKSREVEGRILNATIRRNPSGKYFVSISELKQKYQNYLKQIQLLASMSA